MSVPQYLIDWYLKFCPEPNVDVERIDSGTRDVLSTGTEAESTAVTAPCQYWIKGLPAPCKNWDGEGMLCTYEIDPAVVNGTPTGYGIGGCDGIGRRNWCSKYDPTEGYSDDDHACILPCIERSGSGKQRADVSEYVYLRPWKPEEIKGYNPDDNGVGQCDGMGMGRGTEGFGLANTVSEMRKILPLCKHYKPHMMGFGAIVPRPFHSDPSEPRQYVWRDKVTYLPDTLAKMHDGSPADPLVLMDKRLPYAFKVYSLRARFQKCAHWDDDYGEDFYVEYWGSGPEDIFIAINADASTMCTCKSSACDPYKNLAAHSENPEDYANVPKFLEEVWAQSDSIVCNGAKPECPCYTGKWIYCTDKNMVDGARITANQIMELRFWTSRWSSQEEYDAYFLEKPGKTHKGFADESTADIYTFTHWAYKEDLDVNESIPMGNKHHMCMPAPLNTKAFQPDEYVTITEQKYPSAREFQGTGTHGPEDVAYPTLVRELKDGSDIWPEIDVIYPYYTTDPWNVDPCNEEDIADYCEHANNKMYQNPTISVIGSTLRNREIMVINTTMFDEAPSDNYATRLMTEYARLQAIPEERHEDFFKSLDELLEKYDVAGTAGIAYATSDEYGYFIAEGLELKNNHMNHIFVLCKMSNTDYYSVYTYKYRKVKSVYYGALITQTSFSQTGGDLNSLLSKYTPTADISGKVEPINGHVQEVHPVHHHVSKGLYEDRYFYGYCINNTETEEEDYPDWTQVGSSEYLYVELDNLRISYLFDFDIEEAYLTLRVDDDGNFEGDSPPGLCDSEQASLGDVKINLTYVPIDNRREIPPSAFLLKADNLMGFFNSDWKLYIKYSYKSLDTWRGSDVYWPNFNDTQGPYWVSPAWSVTHSEDDRSFTIQGLSQETAAIMAKISDESGRVQACAAAKMLLYGHRLNCRNVDIFYSYETDAQGWALMPDSGWAINIDANRALSDLRTHRRTPPCGDHECGSECKLPGPMWFPFDSCDMINFYDIYISANFCTQLITANGKVTSNAEAMGSGAAWRWGTADKYQAWVTESYNWAQSCGSSWYYYYSESIGDMRFVGTARKRAKIDVFEYYENQWSLPPFGNNARPLLERWIFRDYLGFLNTSGPIPFADSEYVPMVFDMPDLLQDLDCFAYNEGSYGFSFFPVMSTLLGIHNGEEYEPDEYYRFDDIIDLQYHGGCSYPIPLINNPNGSDITVAVRYGFKDEDMCWAWPRRWYEIDRALNNTQLHFLDLQYPNYLFDYVKQEHRLTLEEGTYDIVFTPPTTAGESEDEDDASAQYASVSINGAHPRYFEIMYDDYSSGYIEWKDEAASGEEGASGGSEGEDEGSIYESANNGEGSNGSYSEDPTWIHDFDTIFGADAAHETSDDRRAVLTVYDSFDALTGNDAGPKYGYFNRGLISKIPKSSLYKLPLDETTMEGELVVEEELESDGSITYNFNLSDSTYTAPTKIKVTGTWGYEVGGEEEQEFYSKPSVEVAERLEEDYDDSEGMVFPEDNIIETTSAVSGYQAKNDDNELDLVDFELNIYLSTFPTRMNRKVAYFQVRLSPLSILSTNEAIDIRSVEATVGKYTTRTEKIKCWERFYSVSKQSIGSASNADGPDTKAYRAHDYSNKNAGQYFPADNNTTFPDGGEAISKLTIINSGEVCTEDEVVEFSDLGSLVDFEKNGQTELYNEAYDLEGNNYDTLRFVSIVPPYVSGFLDYLAVDPISLDGCVLTYAKIPWEEEYHSKQLSQDGEFFQPGGHYYTWSDSIFRTQCKTGGPLEDVYTGKFHHHEHGTQEAQPAMWTGYVWTGWNKYGESEDGNFIGYFPSLLENMNMTGQGGEVPTDITSLGGAIAGGI